MAAAIGRAGISLSTTKERSEFTCSVCLAAVLLLAGCGGSNVHAVEKALAQQRNAQDVRCAEAGRFTYQGKSERLYRCSFIAEADVNVMQAESTCFVYVNGTVADVPAPCLGNG